MREATGITPLEFRQFRDWILGVAGIHLSEHKRALVMGRLASRLRHHGLASYGDYFRLLTGSEFPDERQVALDLLTTNETHFFREPGHFDFLRERILPAHSAPGPFRVWSAACSSGEEPYTIAMTLADALGERSWSVTASDVSRRVLERARAGQYPLARARGIPSAMLRAHCLRGVGTQHGTFAIGESLRRRVQFLQVNLNEALPAALGEFDVIFLRNVMIYFDMATKRRVVERLVKRLRPGGSIFVGHAETLNGLETPLQQVAVSIYRMPSS